MLKYGAQKMSVSECGALDDFSQSHRFDKDYLQQNQKLDEMDLDEIFNRAEDHETMAAAGDGGGASLGGEGFLAQFAALSDVKNDMN